VLDFPDAAPFVFDAAPGDPDAGGGGGEIDPGRQPSGCGCHVGERAGGGGGAAAGLLLLVAGLLALRPVRRAVSGAKSSP
jgi:MYXO-CTERM domain-containing protein